MEDKIGMQSINFDEVWLRAWLAVAGCLNGKSEDCTRYADKCVEEYRKRFN